METSYRYNYLSLSIAIVFAASLLLARVVYALFLSPYSHVPGPRICKVTRLWVDLHDIFLHRNQQIYKWHQIYGPVVLVAPSEVSVSSSASTKLIYRAGTRHPKSGFFNNFTMYGERTIFTALGCMEHRAMRKSTFAFYQPSTVYGEPVMSPLRRRVRLFVDELSGSAHAESTVGADIFKLTNSYAFDNITALVYGPGHASQSLASVREEQTILEDWAECEVWNNLLYTFPLAHRLVKCAVTRLANPRFLHAEERLFEWNLERLDAAVKGVHADDAATGHSLVGRLLRDKTGAGVPRRSFLAAECLDNIHAAQTTVSLALTYAVWLLAVHRSWQREVRAELQALALEDDGLPSFDAIKNAPVLEACLRESLRTKPLSSGRAERIVPETHLYDDVMIPAGTIISTSTIAIQHNPAVFQNPHIYDPGRWLRADEEELRAMEGCYIPFGYGARVCLGKAFAIAEIKLLLVSLLLNFDIHENEQSGTNAATMSQLGTENALPRGLRCDVLFRRLQKA
ncbi:benzoate 4-monooxygenase cytochrome P450 [Cordyceps fumosorosea ARSEF 2679]|uniref:Benzoate 4-monooxygenase cytochrome P450 n=1 Tax=Cordyceps fumosorosea (strain ARSEF 2679) TaxID=1081104 RepID=A0A168D6W1_CORFA|nr:benzoate 4-monooxygenase cytochrome P450 [Cordyceps fumosorosea ARSEF 2679]OAA72236.1 benzoate 4-monooxygenase cytochrome P450 [Cordyceps fumosorosea ARSEF 2679]